MMRLPPRHSGSLTGCHDVVELKWTKNIYPQRRRGAEIIMPPTCFGLLETRQGFALRAGVLTLTNSLDTSPCWAS